eukprot:1377766-Amorphochlora_amoeboformis.AAC.1
MRSHSMDSPSESESGDRPLRRYFFVLARSPSRLALYSSALRLCKAPAPIAPQHESAASERQGRDRNCRLPGTRV